MSLFDSLAAIVLALSLTYSLIRGMVREIFSLLSYIGGYFLAINFRHSFSKTIYEYIPNTTASEIISFGIIFSAGVIGISMVGKVVQTMVQSAPGFSGVDRLFGGILGLVKGGVILIILMFPLQHFPDLNAKFTRGSILAPHLKSLSSILSQGLDTEKLKEKLPSFDVQAIKDKVKLLKNFEKSAKDLTSKSVDAIQKDENSEEIIDKPQDDYTAKERNELNDILLSLDKK